MLINLLDPLYIIAESPSLEIIDLECFKHMTECPNLSNALNPRHVLFSWCKILPFFLYNYWTLLKTLKKRETQKQQHQHKKKKKKKNPPSTPKHPKTNKSPQ